MRGSRFKIVCQPLLLAILLFCLCAGSPWESEPDIPDISERINAFTVDLLKHQAEQNAFPANTIISPQSIFHGLAMSYLASGGDTRKELQAVLHFPERSDDLLKAVKDLRAQLHDAAGHTGIELSLANAAWLDETHADFRKEYVDQVRNGFDASLFSVKFEQKEQVCNEINKWVSDATHGHIQESIHPRDIDSRSRPGIVDEPALVAVNAVYFKGNWGSRFDKESTRIQPFHVDESTTVETPMMHQQSLLPYAETKTLKFLDLPYIDNQLSMYVILPKNLVGIRELMQGVTMDQVVELRDRAFIHEVDVLLPRFEMKSHFGMKEALSAMGVKSAFSKESADFDDMIVKKPEAFRVYLDEVYHDAWIDVHEEGTKAAAATSTVHYSLGCSASIQRIPAEFHADHPFLFMIVHNDSRSVLFAGWMSHPGSRSP